MKTVNIKLSLAENVKKFVNIVNKYPYEIDLRSGRHVVDAKSILGIFRIASRYSGFLKKVFPLYLSFLSILYLSIPYRFEKL